LRRSASHREPSCGGHRPDRTRAIGRAGTAPFGPQMEGDRAAERRLRVPGWLVGSRGILPLWSVGSPNGRSHSVDKRPPWHLTAAGHPAGALGSDAEDHCAAFLQRDGPGRLCNVSRLRRGRDLAQVEPLGLHRWPRRRAGRTQGPRAGPRVSTASSSPPQTPSCHGPMRNWWLRSPWRAGRWRARRTRHVAVDRESSTRARIQPAALLALTPRSIRSIDKDTPIHYRTLGKSGAVVSRFALGTMTFGAETGETTLHAILGDYVGAAAISSTRPTYTAREPRKRSSGAGSQRTPQTASTS